MEAPAGVKQGGAVSTVVDLARELQGDAEVVAAADDAARAYAKAQRARAAIGSEASCRLEDVQAAVEGADCLSAPSAARAEERDDLAVVVDERQHERPERGTMSKRKEVAYMPLDHGERRVPDPKVPRSNGSGPK